jgi:AraC-like DNA-binding protein
MLEELLQSFYQLTKIRIVVFGDDFRKIAEAPGYHSAFCSLIRRNSAAAQRCHDSDRLACERCRDANSLYTYVCHAGLTETVTPIRYGNIVIGYLMIGQVLQLCGSGMEELWADVRDRCSGYVSDMDALRAAFMEVQPLQIEQMYATARILEACAGYLWLMRTISLSADNLPARIDEYISGNLDADLSAAALCGRFSISRSQLYKIAREYYGCGIEQTTRALRVSKAKELLESGSSPVSEVASLVGYQDYNYFIKVFKKETGATPARYRKAKKSSADFDIDGNRAVEY